ncbi:MAG TPA: hypothetical protein VJ904_13540, partial [Tichowtungia sp.]|nr:hypothetical protein [Tichowtungia sp.]
QEETHPGVDASLLSEIPKALSTTSQVSAPSREIFQNPAYAPSAVTDRTYSYPARLLAIIRGQNFPTLGNCGQPGGLSLPFAGQWVKRLYGDAP